MSANKITIGFEALSQFDYFKAKKIFYQCLKKNPCEASFGLATIYYRNDNPFTNNDSACKYITICKKHLKNSVKNKNINQASVTALQTKIAKNGYNLYCVDKNVNSLNYFLEHYFFCGDTLLNKALFYRDSLKLGIAKANESSNDIKTFLLGYPQSILQPNAWTLFYKYEYNEQTPQKNSQQLQNFIIKFKKNPNVIGAEELLFSLVKDLHESDTLYRFIKNYSTTLTRDAAWKLLYSISMKKYSHEGLTNFLTQYPDYPYSERLLNEIVLEQTNLFPVTTMANQIGYVDSLGNWKIEPQFDDALPFSEGLAAVCKNDSCFYINKDGVKNSINYFEEAETYHEGVAIVKNDGKFYLINRSGQFITNAYDDINESSENLYVCKSNNSYGAINAKGEVIIPFVYAKLGNFKNKYAYYLSTQYGLVDIHNNALQAQWDWISDVDSAGIAIVKKLNKFGLMNITEQILLPVDYDYIVHCQDEIYLIVKNNQYGFYNAPGNCFITSLSYDFDMTLNPKYYTDGRYYKLIVKGKIALIDGNGRYSINFGSYTDLHFAQCDMIRVKKNNKFGFMDRKLKEITPFVFDEATDFSNNRAIVRNDINSSIIDKNGKLIYTIKQAEIIAGENNLFLIKQNNLIGLVDENGKVVLDIEYESIDKIRNDFYLCKKNNELCFINLKTKHSHKL